MVGNWVPTSPGLYLIDQINAYQDLKRSISKKNIKQKKLDLKLTLGMAERRLTESPPDEESWGEGQWFKSQSDRKSPSQGVWLFLVQLVAIPVEHSSDVKQKK